MGVVPSDIANRAAGASAGLRGELGNTVQSCPKVTLELGIFFDGTLNNEFNTLSGQNRGTSYTNARSNVSLLKDLYKNREHLDIRNSCGGFSRRHRSRYVEGIGSSAGRRDDIPGKAFGLGSTGIESRVYAACLWVGQQVDLLSPGVEPAEIIMDVFGFSRGAAAARYFVNCFRQGFIMYDPAFRLRRIARLPAGRKVRFRFIGIFDTVAAVGWADNDDNGPVNVHLKVDQAEKIYHLTAENEYRINFRLNKNVPGGGETKSLPGAHSDVGGGYRDTGDRSVTQPVRQETYMSREAAEAARQGYLNRNRTGQFVNAAAWQREGWVGSNPRDGGLRWEVGPIFHVPSLGFQTYSFLVMQVIDRPWVRPGLSRIALRMMYDKAKARGVPFTTFLATEEYTIPADLARMADRLIAGGEATVAEKHAALQNFGHVSANEDTIGMGGEPSRVRVEYDNQASLAK
jgi:hypothetical protein